MYDDNEQHFNHDKYNFNDEYNIDNNDEYNVNDYYDDGCIALDDGECTWREFPDGFAGRNSGQ